jgi:anti-sigma regulatory factor (Ser/Thr protein kinase)
MFNETIETAELLVSELVTNAVKFAGPLPAGVRHTDLARVGIIDIMLRYLPDQLVIEVSDSDSRPPRAANPAPDSEGGRGLILVEALSKEWSYYFPPSGGKTVYCIMALDEIRAVDTFSPWTRERT